MPKRKIFKSPDEMREAVYTYHQKQNMKNKFPSEPGLFIALDIIERDKDLETYIGEDNPDREGYIRVLEEAKVLREAWLNDRAVTDPKLSTACVNLLKQEKNGGYRDKAAVNNDTKLIIDVRGIGGEGAFE